MGASEAQPAYLDDSRLAALATDSRPAWLWSLDPTQIVWANPIGAAVFGAASPDALRLRRFDRDEPAPAQIARIASSLSGSAKPRLERLRGFGAGMGRTLTCACSRIALADQTAGVLVVALERAGPALPLGERVVRLLAGGTAPIAAFAPDGVLMAATESAQAHLAGAGSLAALGAHMLAESALAHGHAAGRAGGRPIALDRIGRDDTTVLIARFGAPLAAREPLAGAPAPVADRHGQGPIAAAGNVVPFRSAAEESNGPSLSPVERSAFQELSRKLTQRLAEAGAAPRRHVAAASLLEAPGPVSDGPPDVLATDEAPQPRMAVLAGAEPGAANLARAQVAEAGPTLHPPAGGGLQAAQARSELLARISHDIRTPLNSIIGFAQLMIEASFGPIGNTRYQGYLEDIRTSGEQLLSLINDLLALSDLEAGRLEPGFVAASLNELARECVAVMQPQAGRARVVIRNSLPSTLPHVVVDVSSVRQMVLRVLSSSLVASSPGGQVIVSTALEDSGEVALRVRHRGAAVSAQALAPSRQFAMSVPEVGGLGTLDLALAKALAEMNGASFLVKSAPNEATLVEVIFARRGVPA
jgi:signal transduction histidine kinase